MTDSRANDEALFERLAALETPEPFAPSRLKSRVYSALMREATRTRQMQSLGESEAAGGCLCVFERFVQILPLPAAMATLNYCRFCHPRLLGEAMEGAPVFWKGCPYAEFQRH